MDELLSSIFLGNTLAQWLIAAAFIGGGLLVGIIGSLVVRKLPGIIYKNKPEKLENQIITVLGRPLALFLFLLGIIIGLHRLQLNDTVLLWTDRIYNSFLIIIITSTLTNMLDKIIIRFIPQGSKVSSGKTEAKIQPMIRKFSSVVLWIIAIILILKTIGYNVNAMIAGLGLGGAALALASKDTLSNFFGSITVFMDRPFRLYDRIKVGNYDGVITEMGLRTSKLKTSENRTVFIPNSIFASQPIENVSVQPNIKVVQTITFTSDNGSKKIAQALEIIKEIADSTPGLEGKSVAGLTSIGAANCQASFVYYVSKKADYSATVNRINVEILRRFEEEAIRLA